MVILGGGYAVTILESLGWVANHPLFYWGDIDTHGFAILNRVRQRFPHTRSLLMNVKTLLARRRRRPGRRRSRDRMVLTVQTTVGLDQLPFGPWVGLAVLAVWAAVSAGGARFILSDPDAFPCPR